MKLWESSKPFSFLAACFLLFFNYACEEAGGIGEEIGVNVETGVFFSDTFAINTSTVLIENNTKGASRILVGQYKDPVFGIVQAKGFFEMLPDSLFLLTNSDFNASEDLLVYDSLILNLPFQYVYADTTAEQKFNLHRITEEGGIDSEKDFTNNSSLTYDPTPLASFQFKASTIQAKGGVTLKFDDTFGQEIFNYALNNTPRTEFRENFKGFVLVADTTFNNNASIVGFKVLPNDFTDGNVSFMSLYYTEQQKREGKSDTLFNRVKPFFALSGQRFNQIKSDRSNTPLVALQAPLDEIPSSQSNFLTYLQSGTGVVTKLEFPTLKNISTLGNVAINRAELVIKSQTGSSLDLDFVYPFNIIFHLIANGNEVERDDNGNPVFIIGDIDRSTGQTIPLTFSFNTRFEEYRGILTDHFNEVLSGRNSSQSLFIIPNSNITTTNRVILNNSPESGFSMQLRVFYTVFK
ncbi:MAG: DUF4270 family protein [Microscillaceae bacterium]|nr:DUF4270 family protein [Microscillaceae bacterium]